MKSIGIFYDVAYPFVDGGGQKRIYEIATRLRERKFAISWYCLKTWDGPDVYIRDGIQYLAIGRYRALYTASGRRSIPEAISYGIATLKHRKCCRNHDVIWCGQWPYFHIVVLWLSGSLRGRILVVDWWETWRNKWFEYLGPLGVIGRFAELLVAHIASNRGRLVTPGIKSRDDLIGLGVRAKAVSVIDNGINLKVIQSAPQDKTISSDIVSFGRLKDHKNLDHIIKALASLKRDSIKLRLSIIGDGPERQRLEEMTKALNIESQVKFYGRIESDSALYGKLKSHKIFVHPSTKEGGGSITLIEANACGLPVVAYEHEGGIDPSLIVSGRTGVLVSPPSPESLSAGMMQILSSWNLEVTKNACIAKSAAYDWGCAADKYALIFNNSENAQ